MTWKILQILVWILAFLISFDLVMYFLELKLSEKNSEIAQTPGAELHGISEWIIGGLCLVALILLRILFKRSIPSEIQSSELLTKKSNNLCKKSDRLQKKVNTSKKSGVIRQQSDQEVKRRYVSSSEVELQDHQLRTSVTELSNSISQSTFNAFPDESLVEVPSQLNPGQLQVLLEELKFTVDEKFGEIDSWIDSNEHGTKLWSKRLERVETELSYIRHQIFILMSCSTKQNLSLCNGDASKTSHHTEALSELSTILAQVKKQYNEDELKEKTDVTDISVQKPVESEIKIKNYSDNCLEELKRIDEELNHNILNDFAIKQESNLTYNNDSLEINLSEFNAKVGDVQINDKEPDMLANNVGKYSKESDLIVNDNSDLMKYSKERDFFTNKNEFLNNKVNGLDKYEKINNDVSMDTNSKIKNSYTKMNYLKDDFKNEYSNIDNYSILTEDIYTKSNITFDNSNLSMIEIKFDDNEINMHSIPSKVNEKGDSSDYFVENHENYYSINSFIRDQSETSTNLFDTGTVEEKEPNMDADKDVDETKGPSRSVSPKRSVRFAQSRDVSPSKVPTWLSVTKDTSPVKLNKKISSDAVSDSKVVNDTVDKTIKTRRELSFPGSEKRVSRRTILERELTYLERSVSPSPTRNRNLKNVRSVVADYIKGNKKKIY